MKEEQIKEMISSPEKLFAHLHENADFSLNLQSMLSMLEYDDIPLAKAQSMFSATQAMGYGCTLNTFLKEPDEKMLILDLEKAPKTMADIACQLINNKNMHKVQVAVLAIFDSAGVKYNDQLDTSLRVAFSLGAALAYQDLGLMKE